jgi:hypothetical protein
MNQETAMNDSTGSDLDFIWTPWGWVRLRSWTHTATTGTPGRRLSIQLQGTSITIKHS